MMDDFIQYALFWANYSDLSRRVVTPNGGLVRESRPQIPLIQV